MKNFINKIMNYKNLEQQKQQLELNNIILNSKLETVKTNYKLDIEKRNGELTVFAIFAVSAAYFLYILGLILGYAIGSRDGYARASEIKSESESESESEEG